MEEVLQLTAMNTAFYIKVFGCKEKNWREVISNWIIYVEKEWSRFRKDNELYQLNELNMGQQMRMTPPLLDILQKAEEYRKLTNGLFSPYLYPQMNYHGYEQTFPFQIADDKKDQMPKPYTCDSAPFEFFGDTVSVRRVAEGKVDLGGIAKGYAVQSAVRWLKEFGQADAGIVDGGGDITVWSSGDKEWKIGVAHPFEKEQEIAQFRLKNGGIATSNIVYRSWKQGNETKHHILNGQTGIPVDSSVIQATVAAENCLDAEAAAKICFMVKVKDLENELKKFGTIHSYLLVHRDGTIITKK